MKDQSDVNRVCQGSVATAVVILALVAADSLVKVQAAECDCSCQGYSEMLHVMEEARLVAESGNYEAMPDEAARVMACAGTCSQQWAQCGGTSRDVSHFRQSDAPSVPGAEDLTGEPLQDDLTADYLSGTWCSVYGGQEVTQWEFEPNGDHRIGFPSGSRMAMRAEIHPVESFHERYETLIDRDANTFTTRHKHGRDNVFTRGACDD